MEGLWEEEKRTERRASGEHCSAAAVLFMEKGISQTSMDDIAKAAGYSKATLYVYFESKEEIVSVLVLGSMKKLCAYISSAIQHQESTRSKYDLICKELVRYQEEYPFYFKMTLEKIKFHFESQDFYPEERETFQVGEEINEMIKTVLMSGMVKGDLRADLDIAPVSFSCWGMLSGLIQFTASKADYIKQSMGLSKEQFLQCGFDMIYQSIAGMEVKQ